MKHLQGVGAVVVVVLLLGSMIVTRQGRSASAVSRPDSPVTTVTAPNGTRATLSLPDGSDVILGAGSTLSYPIEFDRRREVTLEGEAYFRVVPRARRPFQVRLRGAAAQVVDTDPPAGAGDRQRASFTVRAYPEDPFPRVAVRDGQVLLGEHLVRAGQVSGVSPAGEPTLEAADTATWFSWTSGRLTFTHSLREALPRLSRFYDLDIRLADSAVGDAVLVATLPDTLSNGTLDILALVLSARVERDGRVVTFYRDLANGRRGALQDGDGS